MDPARETELMNDVQQKLGQKPSEVVSKTLPAPTPSGSTTIQSLANKIFYPEGRTPDPPQRFSGNNQSSSLADASVNFNPLSAGIRAAGDVGSALINGAFGLASQDKNIDWQKQQWNREWDSAKAMGLYSPSQISNAMSGTPSSTDVYKLNYRGLQRQPRTTPGSRYGT